MIYFEDTNGIPMMAGKVRNPKYVRKLTIGFDYNVGQNVIWNPQAQVFKAIEF